MKAKIEQWCKDSGFYMEDSYHVYGSEIANIIQKFVQSQFPTEKEMEQEFKEYLQMDTIPDKDDPEHYDYSWGRVVWMAAYDHLKKRLEDKK